MDQANNARRPQGRESVLERLVMAATSPYKSGTTTINQTGTGHRHRTRVVMIDRPSLAQTDSVVSSTSRVSVTSGPQVDIEDLYPSLEAGSPELGQALRLLRAANAHVREANSLLQGDDPNGADLAIQRLHGLLAELFNCRRLGDGFGTLINALFCSLENLNGAPMSLQQVNAVGGVLSLVRREPYIDFAAATAQVDMLEEAGLSIDPAGFEYLADWLDGESVR